MIHPLHTHSNILRLWLSFSETSLCFRFFAFQFYIYAFDSSISFGFSIIVQAVFFLFALPWPSYNQSLIDLIYNIPLFPAICLLPDCAASTPQISFLQPHEVSTQVPTTFFHAVPAEGEQTRTQCVIKSQKDTQCAAASTTATPLTRARRMVNEAILSRRKQC